MTVFHLQHDLEEKEKNNSVPVIRENCLRDIVRNVFNCHVDRNITLGGTFLMSDSAYYLLYSFYKSITIEIVNCCSARIQSLFSLNREYIRLFLLHLQYYYTLHGKRLRFARQLYSLFHKLNRFLPHQAGSTRVPR